MTAEDAKTIADQVNQDNIDKADADLDHVQIEINESAKRGEYSLSYLFVPDIDYSRVNEIRNQLSEAGFEVEITSEINDGKDCLALQIDWSTNR